jgi:glyoxylase-like metal-dependent hydrolase (beta-lactamase superfamily II)
MRIAATLIGLAGAIGVSLGLAWAAPANTPQGRADAAYNAMGLGGDYRLDGGAQARDTLVTLTTRGSVQVWDPGESDSVSDPAKPDWGISTFVQRWDRSKGIYRTEWVRPRATGGMRNYAEIVSTDGGYVIGTDVNGAMPARTVQGANNQPLHTMSGLRLRALLREQDRSNIAIAMHDNPERLSDYPDQTVGGKRYPAVQYRSDHGTFIVMFDPASNLPVIVRTRDWDVHAGDSDFDATFSDWRDVMGFKLPFHIVHTLNGVKIFDTKIDSYAVNGALPTDAFNVPVALRGKAPPPAAIGKVPYQWVLRRLGNGFYLDSDARYTDDGGALRIMDVAPNISLVTGGSHNTLIVATNTYLVAFDAPGDDGLSQIAIDLAKQKYPGKPFRYVVLTHHHIDHTGGLRAYAAEGATIVVGKGNGAFFRKVLAAPSGLNLYTVKTFTPRVIEVDDKWTVNDGGREISAYSLPTTHATGYLIPYVPDAKLGFVTDLWGPGAPLTNSNPNLVEIVNGVQKMGIQPERFAGGHGAVGNYADVVRVVQAGGAR